MAQLVLLVVAAAWAAVLIPPMLRSRVENRPNSSVTDFRRQLNKLQSSATPSRGAIRPIGRPLAQSPLQRPAAGGRPGVHSHHRQAALRGSTTTAPRSRTAGRATDHGRDAGRFRSHGDPFAEHDRPHRQTHMHRPAPARSREAERRREPAPHQIDPQVAIKRRRTNVLFILIVTAGCTLFLAATTSSTVMPWMFGASFLALCGYVYLLAQLRQREAAGWNDGWFEHS